MLAGWLAGGLQMLTGGAIAFLHRQPFDLTFRATVTLNRWTHVAGTYNAATGQAVLYINGQQVTDFNLMPG
jgi:hypothetical protein